MSSREQRRSGAVSVAIGWVTNLTTSLRAALALAAVATVAVSQPAWLWLPLISAVGVLATTHVPDWSPARVMRLILFEIAWGGLAMAVVGDLVLPLLILPAATAGSAAFVQGVRPGGPTHRRPDALTGCALSVAATIGYAAWAVAASNQAEGPAIVSALAAVVLVSAPAVWAVLTSTIELDTSLRRAVRPSAIARANARLHDPIREAGHALQNALLALRANGAETSAVKELEAVDERVEAILGSLSLSWVRIGRPPTQPGIPERGIARMRSFFQRSMESWQNIKATPEWWPRDLRTAWTSTVAPVLDTVRTLHTRRIEILALHLTLWLRALLVGGAGALGTWMAGGLAPWTDGIPQSSNIVWIAATIVALVTAAASVQVVDRTLEPETSTFRRNLFAVEEIVSLAALVAVPSWATFAMTAGPHNWIQRPDWHLRRLVALGVVNVAVFSASLVGRGASLSEIAGQVLLGIGAVLVISNSYGLMLPFVAYAALARPLLARARRERLEEDLLDPRVHGAVREIDLAEGIVRSQIDSGQVPAVTGGAQIEGLRTARRTVLAAGREPRRRPARTLATIFHEAITGRVPTASLSSAASIQATQTAFVPADLGEWRTRSRRISKALEDVVGRIASEAQVHGVGLLQTSCRMSDGRITVTAANDIDPTRATRSGHQVGGSAIKEAVTDLPDGTLVLRKTTGASVIGESNSVTVFAVQFTFDADQALQPPS